MPGTAPVALGRGLVVEPGGAVPAPWRDVPVVELDEGVLTDPATVVVRLHRHWSAREPVVVELRVDPAHFRSPASVPLEPWALGPGFEPWHDRLHFLVWANSYDLRDGELVWWWARKAQRLGALPGDAVVACDCRLADGTPV